MAGVTRLEHRDARIEITDRGPAGRDLLVLPARPGVYIHRTSCLTRYPDALIQTILEVKGPGYLVDEIQREEDPGYIRQHLELSVAAHLDPAGLDRQRLLDFGCGAGASTVILGRLLPRTEIVGVDLNEGNLRIARERADFYGLSGTTFLLSPGGDRLPEGIGRFHGVMLSAVFEHLLPDERRTLMPMLWSLLEPGGALILDETPARWFPIETHTSGLPLINYLPDRAAAALARRCSRRVPRTDSWETMLRNGIRGASLREVLRTLEGEIDPPVLLPPARLGLRDYVDLWFRGYVRGDTGGAAALKRAAVPVLRGLSKVTGTPMVPYLSMAVRKTPAGQTGTPD